MKKYLLIILIAGLTACNNNSSDEKIETTEITTTELSSSNETMVEFYNPAEALWIYEFDSTIKKFGPVQNKQFSRDTLTIQKITGIVNKTWPRVQVMPVKTSHDTLYISIPDSEVLTQQLGTSGAEEFIASTTWSYTELPEIKYVSYDFKAGTHAEPGVFHRAMWKK